MLTYLDFSSFHYFCPFLEWVVLPAVGKHSVEIAVEFAHIFWGMMFLLRVADRIPGACQSSLQQLCSCSCFWKELSVTKSRLLLCSESCCVRTNWKPWQKQPSRKSWREGSGLSSSGRIIQPLYQLYPWSFFLVSTGRCQPKQEFLG